MGNLLSMTECYMCSKEAISQEHIPPICFFPDSKDVTSGVDYRKNIITVPACAEHTLEKTGDDEYLFYILLANFEVNSTGLREWKTNIIRSMKSRLQKRELFRDLNPMMIQGILTGKYEIDYERIERQFDRISRGIYYHHFHRHWPFQIGILFPGAISIGLPQSEEQNRNNREIASSVQQFLQHEKRLGNNQEIFFYQYKIREDILGYMLRMVFYGGIEVITISTKEKEP
jgi:hypothetical protein